MAPLTLDSPASQHTATLLADGRVLVAGGSGPSAITEVLSPPYGSFSDAGGFSSIRSNHTSTLLPNGQVLLAGGNNGAAIPNCDLCDPITNNWTATGNLINARYDHTATLLPNGQLLVAGGIGTSGTLTSAELYNPMTGSWTATGDLNFARYSHTATLLPNGLVLVAGGSANATDPPLASVELYNPATGTWTVTGSLNAARSFHTATLLGNGQVLVSGGSNGSSMSSCELYNPTTGAWATTGSLNYARYYHTATLIPSGAVLAAGGMGTSAALGSIESFNPASGTWIVQSGLTYARYQHTATLLSNGDVLFTGGVGASTSAELINPATFYSEWGLLSLIRPRSGHTATLTSTGQVILAGGVGDGTGEFFDPSVGSANTGFGYTSATRPLVNAVTSASSTTALNLTGTGFTGISESSSGNSQNSSSNIPVVQLQFLGNEQVINVPLDPNQGFTSTAFTSGSVTGGVPGYALMTMYVNGTPSVSRIISYTMAAQTIPNFPATQTLSADSSPITLPTTTTDGMNVTYIVQSGPATISSNILTFTGSGTVVLIASAPGDGTYSPIQETDTITVTAAAQLATDSPTLPMWGLALMSLLLVAAATKSRPEIRLRTKS